MDRRLPEVVAAGRLKGLRLKLGVPLKLLVDDRLDAALGADLGEELAKDAITKPVKLLNLPPAPQIGHHLGRDGADGAKRAAGGRVCWAPHQDTPSHRQTARCPKCSGAMTSERGLELPHKEV